MFGWKARRPSILLGAGTPGASLLLSAGAAFLFLQPSLAAPLQYDRAAIAGGEVWRLFSGHWVHSSFEHLFWDLLAFGFLGMACEGRSRSRFLTCVVTSAFAISLVIWFLVPGMMVYRGLSGVDSALFGLLFVELWSEGIRSRKPDQTAIAAICLAAFLLKISFELVAGDTLFVESAGSGWVGVPLAHIAGATVGFLVGFSGHGPAKAGHYVLSQSYFSKGRRCNLLPRFRHSSVVSAFRRTIGVSEQQEKSKCCMCVFCGRRVDGSFPLPWPIHPAWS